MEGEDLLDEKENGGESPARKPKKQPTTKTYVKRNVGSKVATSDQSSVRGSPMPKKVKKQVFLFIFAEIDKIDFYIYLFCTNPQKIFKK